MSGTVLEPRETATPDLKRHKDVTTRVAGGERIHTRLEQLLEKRYISPAQSEAGRRWDRDYRICFGGGGRSCLDMSPRGNGGWNPSEAREDASKAYHAARAALDGKTLPQAIDMPPSRVVTRCCVDDVPFSELAARLGVAPEVAKARVAQCLAVLAVHYEAEDRRKGSNSTAQTYETALAKFEPEVVSKARR